jgi:nucleoside-diphosphate-sugar epimerase
MGLVMVLKESHAGKVLVTGSEGYIGSVLVPLLRANGYDVLAMDSGWFSEGNLTRSSSIPRYLQRDIREVERSDLRGCNAILHLAALCNDPLGELDGELTNEINYRATVRLAEMASQEGVKRFLFSSSCSMYGLADGDQPVDESADFNPQTAYARSKVEAERDLMAMNNERFCTTMLRNGTAFGISPRQRFDLVVPNLAGHAYVRGDVRLVSDGTPWRPIVHICDIAHAFLCGLEAPIETVGGQAFNIGRDEDNHRIRDIAERVHEQFPASKVSIGSETAKDTRSYRISFAKARERLPGFRPQWNLQKGIQECKAVFEEIGLTAETFEDRRYTRLKQVRYLLDGGYLDDRLKWRDRQ